MVEANPVQGDGIVRNTNYATFRDDKPITPGYSAELISNCVALQYYDDFEAQPLFN